MRSLIKLLVVLLICLVGVGFYRGWFSLSNSGPDKGKQQGQRQHVGGRAK